MPEEDVSDLRDVVDAINKLCDTMKTSYEEYEDCCDVRPVDEELIQPREVVIRKVDTHLAELWTDEAPADDVDRSEDVVDYMNRGSEQVQETQIVSEPSEDETGQVTLPGEDNVSRPTRNEDTKRSDDNKETKTAPSDHADETEAVVSDSELVTAEPTCEPTSDMYYTASSEVSLLSDTDAQERLCVSDDPDIRRDDRNGVMAGHVAAMREHFESMTRTNTPCPDLLRSASPSFEIFRTVTNSPDN